MVTQAKELEQITKSYEDALKVVQSQIKSIDKRLTKGQFKSVQKGVTYDWLNNTSFNNIVYPKDKIPDRLLRLIETRNPIIGAIITLRKQQAVEFANVSHDKDVPGWEFVLKKSKETMSPEREKQKEFLETFMMNSKRPDYQGFGSKADDFRDLLVKYIRDRILIDKVCWEVERDRKGQAVALWVLDGATILPVLPGGFYGSTSQIGVGINSGFNRLTEEIRKAKLQNVPPVEEIAFIQELLFGSSGGGITAAFREADLIYDLGDELNDLRLYKQGLSVVEKANLAVVAFMNALTYNANGLSRGSIPKIAIAMGRDSNYTQEQLEDAQDEWMANFQSMDGQWNIPLLNSDAKVLNLNNSNREMEYQKYLEFSGALICAVCGVDASEMGLRLSQAQNVMNDNQDAKQLFSKNRGIRDLLGGFSYIANKFLTISGFPFAQDWEFRFNGLSTEDKGFEADLRKKNVESIMTVDEIRATMDLPPLKDGMGNIILNSVFMQNKQNAEMAAQGGGEDEGGGMADYEDDESDDFDSMADEAMEGLEKARKIKRPVRII
jgi:hypothetical protein